MGLTFPSFFYSRTVAGRFVPRGGLLIGLGGEDDDAALVTMATHHTETEPPGPFVSPYDLPMPIVAPALYRRSGSAPFARAEWVVDDESRYRTTLIPATATEDRSTTPLPLVFSELLQDFRLYPFFAPSASPGYGNGVKGVFQHGWMSTGAGSLWVTFCDTPLNAPFTPGQSIVFVATPDDGASWVQYLVPESGVFAAYCTTSAKLAQAATETTPARPAELGRLAYLHYPATGGRAEVYEYSRRFDFVTRYAKGKEVPENIGLANFGQRFVHPGFPGAYDEPKATP